MSDRTQAEVAAARTVTAELDDANITPLFRESAEERRLTYPDWSGRIDWGYLRGWWRLNLHSSRIHRQSHVFASISELSELGEHNVEEPATLEPMLGNAPFTLHNVAPYAGGVFVLVHIDWPSDLWTQVTYLVVNP